MTLKGWGLTIIAIGVGSLILPIFGVQFSLFYLFAIIPLAMGMPYPELIGSLLAIGTGIVLWYAGDMKKTTVVRKASPAKTEKKS